MSAQLKAKRCRVCSEPFMPARSFQVACGPRCALEYGKRRAEVREKRREREARAERRVKREAIKTARELMPEAQQAFNRWIRWRDRARPCISCDATNPPERFGGAWDCGHYLTVGAHPELRFEETNAHKQCKGCNRPGGATRAQYRERLVERIGEQAVLALEGPHPPRKYTADELRAIRDEYRRRLREAKKET